jgi:hypothetical protein
VAHEQNGGLDEAKQMVRESSVELDQAAASDSC